VRPPSARIPRNCVTIQPTTFTVDGDGGRVLTATGNPSEEYFVRVHPASSRDVPDHMREEGVTYLTVHFFRRPAVKIRHLINWVDPELGAAQVLSVIGPPRTATGEFSTWLVDCEYRVPPEQGSA
jgi:hypothetical protein